MDKYLSEPSNAQNPAIPRAHSQNVPAAQLSVREGIYVKTKKLSIVSGPTQRSFCLSRLYG